MEFLGFFASFEFWKSVLAILTGMLLGEALCKLIYKIFSGLF